MCPTSPEPAGSEPQPARRPAYEMYLNGQKAYLWDPAAHGSSPLALAGAMDVAVSSSRSDLDPRPGFRTLADQMA